MHEHKWVGWEQTALNRRVGWSSGCDARTLCAAGHMVAMRLGIVMSCRWKWVMVSRDLCKISTCKLLTHQVFSCLCRLAQPGTLELSQVKSPPHHDDDTTWHCDAAPHTILVPSPPPPRRDILVLPLVA